MTFLAGAAGPLPGPAQGSALLSLSPRPHPAQPVFTVPQSAITTPQLGPGRPFTQVAESWSPRLPLRSGLAKAALSPSQSG